MSLERYHQKANIKAEERRKLLAELKQLAISVERCQQTINSLMIELNEVNAKYQGQRSTREEVEYLTVLLACAKKKLAWEKQIASLSKRAPTLLQELTATLNDKEFPPSDEMKLEMLQSLQVVQSALERLQQIPTGASN
ncbi:MAG TPA: hypothetical protein VFB72_03660 [Verrucomicrobiae bacterium]|nr:hypothetical protein [Verrucomicrobiae bacterium]